MPDDVQHPASPSLSRRDLVRTGAALGSAPLLATLATTGWASAQGATPIAPGNQPARATITIDLINEPDVLDPVRTYSVDGWSVVHSIYDTLLFRDAGGTLQPLLAESWSEPDDHTIEFKLRSGVVFHNGEVFDSQSVATTVAHMQDQATASQVAADFSAISSVEVVDSQTVRFHLSQPAPALLSQAAVYLGMLPPKYVSDPAKLYGANLPVGTGPYRFVSWNKGEKITLEANPDWQPGTVKGVPLARTAVFRFVTDSSTRVSDLLSGGGDLVRDLTQDQVSTVNNNDATTTITAPVAGVAFVRMINSQQPWANAEVRKAANHAVDVDGIISTLKGGNGQRLASLLAPQSIGFDETLKPYEFDRDKAKVMLRSSNLQSSLKTTLQISSGADAGIAEVIVAQLNEVGFHAVVEQVDQTDFNTTWQQDKDTGTGAIFALRLVTWRPLFDPQSLLSLMFTSRGALSRFSDTDIDRVIADASAESDPDKRAGLFRQAAEMYHDNPPAIFLWSLTATYGLSKQLTGWHPRSDEYLLPLTGD